jgi:hypothetical protein
MSGYRRTAGRRGDPQEKEKAPRGGTWRFRVESTAWAVEGATLRTADIALYTLRTPRELQEFRCGTGAPERPVLYVIIWRVLCGRANRRRSRRRDRTRGQPAILTPRSRRMVLSRERNCYEMPPIASPCCLPQGPFSPPCNPQLDVISDLKYLFSKALSATDGYRIKFLP